MTQLLKTDQVTELQRANTGPNGVGGGVIVISIDFPSWYMNERLKIHANTLNYLLKLTSLIFETI